MDTPTLPPVMVPKSVTSIMSGPGTTPLPLDTSNRCLANLNTANTNLNTNNNNTSSGQTNLFTPPTSGYVTDDSNGNGSPNSAAMTDLSSISPPLSYPALELEPVTYTEPQYWCSIAYYELTTRVGENYRASQVSRVYIVTS